jgi:5'-nucleotidase (lipoprotein e(P4) family)
MKSSHKILFVILVFVVIALGVTLIYQSNCCNKSSQEAVVSVNNPSEKLINAVSWVQNSAEYRASCYQTFNIATVYLLENMKMMAKDKPAAIVCDLDETLLDNSRYEAQLIKNKDVFYKYAKKDDPENKGRDLNRCDWKHNWTLIKQTDAIPGAVDFLKFVQAQGVEIIFITNREEDEKDATIENMRALGFPEIKPENMYYCEVEGSSSKIARQKNVIEKYDVVLWLGDALEDFDTIFLKRDKNEPKQFDAVNKVKEKFGTKYIILPNPMYGKWECDNLNPIQ